MISCVAEQNDNRSFPLPKAESIETSDLLLEEKTSPDQAIRTFN